MKTTAKSQGYMVLNKHGMNISTITYIDGDKVLDEFGSDITKNVKFSKPIKMSNKEAKFFGSCVSRFGLMSLEYVYTKKVDDIMVDVTFKLKFQNFTHTVRLREDFVVNNMRLKVDAMYEVVND